MCALLESHSCSSEDRQTAKLCLSASISRISFVKKSEIHFLYIFDSDIHDFITSENTKPMNKNMLQKYIKNKKVVFIGIIVAK